MDGQVDGKMVGWADGWMGGQVDECWGNGAWIHGFIDISIMIYIRVQHCNRSSPLHSQMVELVSTQCYISLCHLVLVSAVGSHQNIADIHSHWWQNTARAGRSSLHLLTSPGPRPQVEGRCPS